MDLYLYLKEHRFVDAWVDGGKVPFYVASTYVSDVRAGVYTPDENLIDRSTFDIKRFGGAVEFVGDNQNMRFADCYVGDEPVNGTVNRHYEDGLVICMSTRRSKHVARKLKKTACVKIKDISILKNLIDEFTGVKGVQGLCAYTPSHNRNHFLKSTYDSWQEEYRIFWPNVGNIEIEIPPRLAEPVFFLP